VAQSVASLLSEALGLDGANQPKPPHRGGSRIRPPRVEREAGLDLVQDQERIDVLHIRTPGTDQKGERICRKSVPGHGGVGFGQVDEGVESNFYSVLKSRFSIHIGSGDFDVRVSHRGRRRSTFGILGSGDLIKLTRLLDGVSGVLEQTCFRQNERTACEVMRAFGNRHLFEQIGNGCQCSNCRAGM